MNALIKQLVEQATVEAKHEFGGKYFTFSEEKFAELIVLRCMQVAMDADDPVLAVEMADLFGIM